MALFNETPSSPKTKVCPYEILEITRNASPTEVQEAYRRLALLNHPRRHGFDNLNSRIPSPNSSSPSKRNELGADSETSMENEIQNSESKSKSIKKNEKLGRTQKRDINNFKSNDPSQEQQEKEWKFLLLGAAFETLSDSSFRKRYDSLEFNASMSSCDEKGENMKDNSWEDKAQKAQMQTSFSACLPQFSPSHPSTTTNNNKYGINHLKHYSAYLGSEDDDTTVNTFTSHNTLTSHTTMIPSGSEEQFGGPLHAMYKARNHAAFTEPYRLFNKMFYSDIFHTDEISDQTKSSFKSSSSLCTDEDIELERWKRNFLAQRKHQLKMNSSSISSKSQSLLVQNVANTVTTSKPKKKKHGFLLCGSTTNTDALQSVCEKDEFTPLTYKDYLSNTTTTIENGNKVTTTSRIKDGFKITKTEVTKVNLETGASETVVTVSKEEIDEELELRKLREERKRQSKQETGSLKPFGNWLLCMSSPHNKKSPRKSSGFNVASSSSTCCSMSSQSEGSGSKKGTDYSDLVEIIGMPACARQKGSPNHSNNSSPRANLCVEIKKIFNSCGPFMP